MSMTKGTPASSQIVWLTRRVEALEELNAEMLEVLKAFAADGCVTDDGCGGCRPCRADAAIAKAEAT